jgi:hypothetical protein
MQTQVTKFVEAHDRYLSLDRARCEWMKPQEREMMHIEIMKAYLEVQFRAKMIAGLQYADGMDFADCH